VPSLFTFQVKDPRLTGLPGLSVEHVDVQVPGTRLREHGPLLITHWGLSGPAILKLSAWGARLLHDRDYRFDLAVNWVAPRAIDQTLAELVRLRAGSPRRQVAGGNPFGLPQRLWERLASAAGVEPSRPWTSVSNDGLKALAHQLGDGRFSVTGKSLFKEEFVTCGGVRLEEVDFKTMESRRCPGLYFAGEVLDIDGLTGGFNFQSAWTTGWLAGHAMAEA
jgi:predicted Rossmann fold flavoprotein